MTSDIMLGVVRVRVLLKKKRIDFHEKKTFFIAKIYSDARNTWKNPYSSPK